jgi:hypothetical protein
MTVTTVRPDSTISNVNVNTSGGASAFSVLDDSPTNDATVAQGNTHRATIKLGLATTTVGATNRVKQVKIRARGAHEGTDVGHAEQVNLRLYDPTPGVAGRNNAFVTYSTTFADYAAGYETTPPGGTAWTQAIVDRLQGVAFWLASVNGFFIKISELFVDLDIYSQPVASAVTVAGTTSGTRPTYSFTFAQTEGLPQTGLQVKVFSLAQYSATGFDPATSTATWSSGVLVTDAVTGTVGMDLANGTTYKVYVAAGIDWPSEQGLGSVWYSAWAGSAAFTISVVPPPAPTVVVTVQPDLPGYRNLLRITSPVNLITEQQASLEDTTTTGWAATLNNTISNSSVYATSGTRSLQMSSTASGTMTAEMSTRPVVKAGVTLTALGTVRSAVSARTVRVGIRFYDVSGALIGATNFGSPLVDATGSDTTPSVTVVSPATTYSAAIVLEVQSTGVAAEIHRWDAMDLHYGSVVAWTPGGFNTSASVVVYRSQRISKTIARGPARNWLHPQLFSAGAFTTSTDGFYVRNTGDTIRTMPLDRASPEGPGEVSAGMIEWTVRTTTGGALDIGAPNGVVTDGLSPYLFPAVPGKSMTATVWAWASAAWTTRLGIVYTDRFNTQVGSTTWTAPTALSTTEQRLSVAATPPAGTCFARMVLENNTPAASVQVYLCMPRFRVTADPDEAWPGQVFNWETETVRLLSSAAFADGASDVVLYDHEPPAGRPCLYWARVAATTAAGLPMVSLDSTAVHVYTPAPSRTLLKDPFQPENAYTMRALTDHTLAQDEDADELHILGLDGQPVFFRTWLSGENGKLAVFAASELERYRLDQLHPTARPLLVHWSTGGNTYIRITRRTKAPLRIGAGYWRAEFDYVQTARP